LFYFSFILVVATALLDRNVLGPNSTHPIAPPCSTDKKTSRYTMLADRHAVLTDAAAAAAAQQMRCNRLIPRSTALLTRSPPTALPQSDVGFL